jgi:hypothetical protein
MEPGPRCLGCITVVGTWQTHPLPNSQRLASENIILPTLSNLAASCTEGMFIIIVLLYRAPACVVCMYVIGYLGSDILPKGLGIVRRCDPGLRGGFPLQCTL